MSPTGIRELQEVAETEASFRGDVACTGGSDRSALATRITNRKAVVLRLSPLVSSIRVWLDHIQLHAGQPLDRFSRRNGSPSNERSRMTRCGRWSNIFPSNEEI
jgi:hypothetical protein